MPAPKERRQARAFLGAQGFVNGAKISPAEFADAADETGLAFAKLLELLATIAMGTQGQGPAPIATRIAMEGKGPA